MTSPSRSSPEDSGKPFNKLIPIVWMQSCKTFKGALGRLLPSSSPFPSTHLPPWKNCIGGQTNTPLWRIIFALPPNGNDYSTKRQINYEESARAESKPRQEPKAFPRVARKEKRSSPIHPPKHLLRPTASLHSGSPRVQVASAYAGKPGPT